MTLKFDESLAFQYYNEGMSDRKIAAELHMSTTAILTWRNSYGLPPNFNKHKTLVQNTPTPTDPNKDSESLYCDGEFLKKFVKGEVTL